jgi:hypothetical protein
MTTTYINDFQIIEFKTGEGGWKQIFNGTNEKLETFLSTFQPKNDYNYQVKQKQIITYTEIQPPSSTELYTIIGDLKDYSVNPFS